ncbi:YdeI/OmpD-associated family protein [Salibaculum griseiflavum]|uniref:Bacteriocin-protection, YdeI or OmpD-Associated n=1 Tax=Salibaculum griseiflavum TaxID=1914409 RepID=A0A2V1P796_9RHOB|nr:YdeI/OmpD-associated family protein [Salibaculum griseiflavum]PWG17660.1 hypothetical protein DFK10_05415 [Salibaculum griseiflavum]
MSLTRPRNPMPDDVAAALAQRGLRDAFDARPAYQRNDWLGWIARAKREETRQRRMEKMLAELAQGHGYMGMEWQPPSR